jgi:hypothetical protein
LTSFELNASPSLSPHIYIFKTMHTNRSISHIHTNDSKGAASVRQPPRGDGVVLRRRRAKGGAGPSSRRCVGPDRRVKRGRPPPVEGRGESLPALGPRLGQSGHPRSR